MLFLLSRAEPTFLIAWEDLQAYLHEGYFLCHVMPRATQGELYKVLFAAAKTSIISMRLTKTVLLPSQAPAKRRGHAGLSPAEGRCRRRKHDTQRGLSLTACFWDGMRKAHFSQLEMKPPHLGEATEDVRSKAVPFQGKLCF